MGGEYKGQTTDKKMIYTIKNIKSLQIYDPTLKVMMSHPGWAFIDSEGRTIIQVYGESKKKSLIKYLSDDSSERIEKTVVGRVHSMQD